MKFPESLYAAAVSMLIFSASAQAGIEPSPFTPEINQFGAAVNILESADHRILKVMANPPDETLPGPSLEGAVNRLEAITNQLNSVDDMVFSLASEVMGTEPSPFRLDVIPALQRVQSAAQGISTDIEEVMGLEPCPFAGEAVIMGTEPSPFIGALVDVQCSAHSIAVNTGRYIRQITAGVDCPAIVDPELCVFPCFWFYTDNPANPGYCDYDPSYGF